MVKQMAECVHKPAGLTFTDRKLLFTVPEGWGLGEWCSSGSGAIRVSALGSESAHLPRLDREF
jgi:hypothetical protein